MRGSSPAAVQLPDEPETGLVVLAPVPLDARAARAGAPGARVVRAGVGPRLARRAAARASYTPGAALAVTGVCMAIDPDLEPGDLVLASEVRHAGGTIECPAAGILAGTLERSGIPVRVGPIVSHPHGLLRSERARLRTTGAIAADTGSAWLAPAAGERPFAVLRAVARARPDGLRRPIGTVAGGARAHRALARATWVLDRWASVVGTRRVLLAGPRASCAGVERAIEIVERALELHGPPVYVRKQIVHNAHVVAELEERGAVFVDEVDEVPQDATIVFSAHGVSPRVRAAAAERSLEVIDATCPLVAKVHAEARRFAADGRTTLLIGHAGHEEVEGTVGEAPGRIRVIASEEEAARVEVEDPERVAYLTQTTLAVDETSRVVDSLRRRFPAIVGPPSDDICYATQNRQDAVRAVARSADVMLVVGSSNSSNSNRLVEVARRSGCEAHLIEDERAIELDWFAGAQTIGLAAGASAPERIVQRVLHALGGLGSLDVRERSIATEDVRFRLPREVR
jgi:4-hydroxy-3-methylbut-2-enyl diphosphate reductase